MFNSKNISEETAIPKVSTTQIKMAYCLLTDGGNIMPHFSFLVTWLAQRRRQHHVIILTGGPIMKISISFEQDSYYKWFDFFVWCNDDITHLCYQMKIYPRLCVLQQTKDKAIYFSAAETQNNNLNGQLKRAFNWFKCVAKTGWWTKKHWLQTRGVAIPHGMKQVRRWFRE